MSGLRRARCGLRSSLWRGGLLIASPLVQPRAPPKGRASKAAAGPPPPFQTGPNDFVADGPGEQPIKPAPAPLPAPPNKRSRSTKEAEKLAEKARRAEESDLEGPGNEIIWKGAVEVYVEQRRQRRKDVENWGEASDLVSLHSSSLHPRPRVLASDSLTICRFPRPNRPPRSLTPRKPRRPVSRRLTLAPCRKRLRTMPTSAQTRSISPSRPTVSLIRPSGARRSRRPRRTVLGRRRETGTAKPRARREVGRRSTSSRACSGMSLRARAIGEAREGGWRERAGLGIWRMR